MALSIVSKVDDTTKAILSVSGAVNESGTIYSASSNVSLANVYYEIRGTGTAVLTLGDDTLSLTGFGNWGLKEGEKRKVPLTDLNSGVELTITTDANVSKFNMAIELQKETESYN